jgi:hypothetical protein
MIIDLNRWTAVRDQSESSISPVREYRRSVIRLELRADSVQGGISREQILVSNAQSPGEKKQFAVGHPASLQLKTGNRVSADIPAAELQLGSQCLLRPPFLDAPLPDLWADQV